MASDTTHVPRGARDPTLSLHVHGKAVRRGSGVDQIQTVPAKHFLQEDQAPAVAELVASTG